MNTPLLLSDFDGVFNISASKNSYVRRKDAFGYVRKNNLGYSRYGYTFPVMYSAEMVSKFNSAKNLYGFKWLWLSTWLDTTVTDVDRALLTRSDGYVDWDADGGLPSGTDKATSDLVTLIRADRKYAALLATLRADPRPFVWIDDDATPSYDPKDFVGDLDVPHLVLATDPDYGMLKPDLDRMLAFFDSLKTD
jgi:hypothetical protein